MRNVRTLSFALIGLAVVALAALAVALIPGSNDAKGSDPATEEAASVAPAVAEVVPTLDAPRRATDALPAGLSATLGEPTGIKPDASNYPELSRRSLTFEGGAVYLMPTAQGVCVVYVSDQGAAAPACGTTSQIVAGEPLYGEVKIGCEGTPGPTTTTCDAEIAYGLAPAGTNAVQVRSSSGEVATGRVNRNAYAIELPPGTQSDEVELLDS